ncbi:hypothetical protein PA10_00031 [Pseudomonas phage pPa_SNUABM_DT01]|nr:hypothetical protein PA10_00031 [Pseudomonas phage pPa_SNUABM_DT01]
MQKIVPTQLSNFLQVSNFLGVNFDKKDNTTLNQKFDVQANAVIQPGMIPNLKGFTIGIGGHAYTMGANNIPLSQVVDHSSGDAGLYKHLPFVIRDMNDDLTAGERSKYFLRKIISVDSVNKIAYYGKRLDKTGVLPKMTKRTIVDGQTVIEDYVYTEANLSPTPPEIPNTGAVTTSNEYLATSAIVPMPFTEKDVAELYNVAETLFGDRRMAIISEFGFVTGVDADVSINTSAGAVNFKEVIAAQIAAHISGHYELIFNSKGFDFSLEVGAVQPLLATGQIPTVTMSLLGG